MLQKYFIQILHTGVLLYNLLVRKYLNGKLSIFYIVILLNTIQHNRHSHGFLFLLDALFLLLDVRYFKAERQLFKSCGAHCALGNAFTVKLFDIFVGHFNTPHLQQVGLIERNES
jgi:succinate-acetate transporter protein